MGMFRLGKAEQLAVDSIVRKYKLNPAPVHGNEERAYEGASGKDAVRLEVYDSFAHLEVAFDGAYHAAVPNRMPFGKAGMFEASAYDGMWRGTVVGPMCRTVVGPSDRYLPVAGTDVVAYGLALKAEAAAGEAHKGDLSLMDRNITRPGWGTRGEKLYSFEDKMPRHPGKGVPKPRISR